MRPPRGTTAAALLTAAAWLAAPAAAHAHGLVGRTDLPVPTWLFAWSAAAVLVVSFVGLSALWPSPVLQDPRRRALAAVPRLLPDVLSVFGLAAFVLVVVAGLAGTDAPNANIAPTAVFVVMWVGVPIASLLFGDLLAALSPWRTLARMAAWLGGRLHLSLPARRPYPTRLGHWPAAAMVLAFAWTELVAADGDKPSVIAVLALAYAAIQLIGMAYYGIGPWSRQADGLGVYFAFFARISPLSWQGGKVSWRRPLSGLTAIATGPGTVALLCVMIGSTSFDGATQGQLWRDSSPELVDLFAGVGFGDQAAIQLAGTVGLLVSIAVIAALYVIGVRGMASLSAKLDRRALADRFVHTLIPIALAYVIAHYFSLLVFQGQALGYLVSDPLGRGSDLLGTASATVDYGVVAASTIWYVQVGALVCGHVAALVLAHDRALATFPARQAVRSQYWMLAVMVGYTSLGLWLLSSVGT